MDNKIIYIFFSLLILLSCGRNSISGDEYYSEAQAAIVSDSIIKAYTLADRAIDAYERANETEKLVQAKVFLSMLYYSTNQKVEAYQTISNMDFKICKASDFMILSNYYRIKAHYKSVFEHKHDSAIAYIDTLINMDRSLIPENKSILYLDMLNKVEIMTNAGMYHEAQLIVDMVKTDTSRYARAVDAQLYANQARLLMYRNEYDSARRYAQKILDRKQKLYSDIDNSLTALNIILFYDSLNNNMNDYIEKRNMLETINRDSYGSNMQLRMKLSKERNRLEMERVKADYNQKLYVLCIIIFVILIVIVVLKHRKSIIQRKLIQLTCDQLDAETFRRQLECELMARKVQAQSDELKKANQEIINLSHKLAQSAAIPENEGAQTYLNHLENRLRSEYSDFSDRLMSKYPNLSKTEFMLVGFIRMGLTTTEMTTAMGISRSSLIKARYRLRKKLDISSSSELDTFIFSL